MAVGLSMVNCTDSDFTVSGCISGLIFTTHTSRAAWASSAGTSATSQGLHGDAVVTTILASDGLLFASEH